MKYVKLFEDLGSDYLNNKLLRHAHEIFLVIFKSINSKFKWATDYYEDNLNISYDIKFDIDGTIIKYTFHKKEIDIYNILYLYSGHNAFNKIYWDVLNVENKRINEVTFKIRIGTGIGARNKGTDFFTDIHKVKNDFDKHKEMLDCLYELRLDDRVTEFEYKYPDFLVEYNFEVRPDELSRNAIKKININ